MRELRLILRYMDRDFLFKMIFVLLLYALVPLAEIFLFLYLGDLIGNYLILVIAAVAGLAGVPIALGQIQRSLEKLREKTRAGHPPVRELVDLGEIFAAGILLITPGFITDIMGYLLLVPGIRGTVGRALARRMKRSFRDLYESLRLSAIEEQ